MKRVLFIPVRFPSTMMSWGLISIFLACLSGVSYADPIQNYIPCRERLYPVSVGLDILLRDGNRQVMVIPAYRQSQRGIYLFREGDVDGRFFIMPDTPQKKEKDVAYSNYDLMLGNGVKYEIRCVWVHGNESELPAVIAGGPLQSKNAVPLRSNEILDSLSKAAVSQSVISRLGSINKVFVQKMDEASALAGLTVPSKDPTAIFKAMQKKQIETEGAFKSQAESTLSVCMGTGDDDVTQAAQSAKRALEKAVNSYRPKKH